MVIAADLATKLTADGAVLEVAANDALRAYFAAQDRAAAAGEPERIPFWLRRDSEQGGELEDELRDRVIQRRAAEDEKN